MKASRLGLLVLVVAVLCSAIWYVHSIGALATYYVEGLAAEQMAKMPPDSLAVCTPADTQAVNDWTEAKAKLFAHRVFTGQVRSCVMSPTDTIPWIELLYIADKAMKVNNLTAGDIETVEFANRAMVVSAFRQFELETLQQQFTLQELEYRLSELDEYFENLLTEDEQAELIEELRQLVDELVNRITPNASPAIQHLT